MSLAATLAAGGMRPASFLPTIKCSNCGDEIEISAMGDHVCSQAPPSPKSQPASLSNAFTLRQLNASGSKPAQPSPLQFDSAPPQSRPRAPTFGSTGSNGPRLPRAPLPNINPEAANRPFLAPMARSESPISPAASSRSGSSFSGRPPPPLRSMTSPMPRLWDPRPPSPELSANLDCAFPPFPFGDPVGSRPGSSTGRRTPSDRGSSRAGSRQDSQLPDIFRTESRSPVPTMEGIPSKLDAFAGSPMQTDRRFPSRDERQDQQTRPQDRRRPSMPSLPASLQPAAPAVPSLPFPNQQQPSPEPGPAINASPADVGHDSRRMDRVPPQRPARPTDPLPPSLLTNTSAPPPASTTPNFPLPPAPLKNEAPDSADSHTLSRMQSEPALRGRFTRPTMPDPSHSEPSKAFPARSASRGATARMDFRLQDAPPVPKPVQIHRSNSLHKPSGSDSSTTSSAPSLADSSKGESPVTSAASSVDAYSPLTGRDETDTEDASLRVAGLRFKGSENPGMRAEQSPQMAKTSLRNFARPPPAPLPQPPAPTAEVQPALESPVIPTGANWPLESPMDPAVRNGKLDRTPIEPELPRFSTPPSNQTDFGLSPADISIDEFDPYRATSPQPLQRAQTDMNQPHGRTRSKAANEGPVRPSRAYPDMRSRPQTPQQTRGHHAPPQPPPNLPLPPPIPQDNRKRSLSRRPTVGKSLCRGCGLLIEGKSVKAADGRLTGRWHKHCFVCKTCEQPFTSADFYVIDNHPYCEQHYHEKNGSTCAGCRRGIEGQYLETTSSGPGGHLGRKYHPRCFTCFNCRIVLSEDYFEIGGRVFCERHALAAMRAQPRPGPGMPGVRPGLAPHGASSLKAERRTTKLMMM